MFVHMFCNRLHDLDTTLLVLLQVRLAPLGRPDASPTAPQVQHPAEVPKQPWSLPLSLPQHAVHLAHLVSCNQLLRF